MKYKDIKDKVVVITGGSRGIGKAIAILLAENGADVIVCARKEDELIKVSDLIKSRNGKCEYVIADISDEGQVAKLAANTMKIHGRVDILINNAGVGRYKRFIDSTSEDWDTIINTNLKGVFLCSRAFVPFMITQKSGYIVNIISGAGKSPMRNLSIYCASKFGLAGLTKTMKKELKEFNISVLCLYPGYVKTSFFKNFPVGFNFPANAKEPETVAREVMKVITQTGKIGIWCSKLVEWIKN
jgi:3-oxoacyl-[acyl-carrier protein] reductase